MKTGRKKSKNIRIIYLVVAGILMFSLLHGILFSYSTHKELIATRQELDTTHTTHQEIIAALSQEIEELKLENESITSFLSEEQKRNVDLEKVNRSNERQIDTLHKLTTIDPELLKKYSKVFFLSENYSPPELKDVQEKFKIRSDKDIKVLHDIEPFLNNLLSDAHKDGIDVRVISGYRSFDEQMSLKSTYVSIYGSGANQFSADQGYSEHQLGTTVDFGTPEVPGALMAFEKTTAFTWLQENAHQYGFIMSYPKGNSYYQYEPWHWRFVGRDLARELKRNGKAFYEMDQREIDTYLIDIFE